MGATWVICFKSQFLNYHSPRVQWSLFCCASQLHRYLQYAPGMHSNEEVNHAQAEENEGHVTLYRTSPSWTSAISVDATWEQQNEIMDKEGQRCCNALMWMIILSMKSTSVMIANTQHPGQLLGKRHFCVLSARSRVHKLSELAWNIQKSALIFHNPD